jgi:hypothetical protein
MRESRAEFITERIAYRVQRAEIMKPIEDRGFARPNNPSHWVILDVGGRENRMELDQGECL